MFEDYVGISREKYNKETYFYCIVNLHATPMKSPL